MIPLISLLAEGEAATQNGPPLMSYLMFAPVLLLVLMFFRASSKQKREQQSLLANMKKNDKVVTSGGILGTIVSMKDNEDEVTLRVDDTSNTRIRVLKSSIVRVTSGETPASETK
ncbi:MAG TPA: preprotein translocase subunit YajC [Gemmataceae bacterium]|nr:preprotein translocase subunit YajC [Gemmataceae bacterium]